MPSAVVVKFGLSTTGNFAMSGWEGLGLWAGPSFSASMEYKSKKRLGCLESGECEGSRAFDVSGAGPEREREGSSGVWSCVWSGVWSGVIWSGLVLVNWCKCCPARYLGMYFRRPVVPVPGRCPLYVLYGVALDLPRPSSVCGGPETLMDLKQLVDAPKYESWAHLNPGQL